MGSWPDPTHEMQGRNEADGSMAAHPQITHIIKEDDASRTSWIDWFAQ
jgi:hypothetical protein